MKHLKKYNTLADWEDSIILYTPNVSYIIEGDEIKYSKSIKVGDNIILYTSYNNQTFTPYSTTAFGASIISNTYENGLGVIKFDSTVPYIEKQAFDSCPLTSITIPNSVTSIGDGAFMYCSSLTSVTIGNSVTSIGSYAFARCSSLASVTIPNSVTSIGDGAFKSCSSLASVTIPNSVTSIGSYAFYGCRSLKTITCEATTPPTLGSSNNLSSVTAVYVPAESVEAYKTATNWSYYSSKIQAIQ